jgi:hypothetical protein
VEVVGKGDFEVLELFRETLVQLVFGLFRVVDGRLVTVVEQMSSCD